jgi:hypothetical protein
MMGTWYLQHGVIILAFATLTFASAVRWRLRRRWPLAALALAAGLRCGESVLTWPLLFPAAAAWFSLFAMSVAGVGGLAIVVAWIREPAPDAGNAT